MQNLPSTRGYLLRAMHEWCSAHGFTPYITVWVDQWVRVPMQHVVKNEIVLNIAADATGGLVIGNNHIQFKARFGGVPQDIVVPVGNVLAVYARENGQGMAFPFEPSEDEPAEITAPPPSPGLALVPGVGDSPVLGLDTDPEPPPVSGKTRPALKRVK